MRKYITIDKITGKVLQTVQWGDNRDLPTNFILKDNEEVITIDAKEVVDTYNIYDFISKTFYLLDITDKDVEISDILTQLSKLDLKLSRFQEDTWTAMGVNELLLPQIWQDRLKQKRDLRDQLKLFLNTVIQ